MSIRTKSYLQLIKTTLIMAVIAATFCCVIDSNSTYIFSMVSSSSLLGLVYITQFFILVTIQLLVLFKLVKKSKLFISYNNKEQSSEYLVLYANIPKIINLKRLMVSRC